MEILWNIVGSLIVALTVLFVVTLCVTIKTKNRTVSFSGGIFCLLILTALVSFLGQRILGFILLIATFIICVAMFPKMMQKQLEQNSDKFVKTLENTDFSESLQLKDVFSWTFILKLERKYSVPKAMAIYASTYASIVGVVMLVMCLVNLRLWPLAVVITAASFIFALIAYDDFKKRRIRTKLGTYYF